jgi:hypothetical protein
MFLSELLPPDRVQATRLRIGLLSVRTWRDSPRIYHLDL